MTATASMPAQTQVMTALRGFIISLFPQGTATFSGDISGTTLTAGVPANGTLGIGSTIMGQGVFPGTYIVGLGTGTGGAGTYVLNRSQTVASSVFSTGVPVVQGQVNRVPEVKAADFVVMWPILKRRLSTNKHSSDDVSFAGSIAGNTLTVTQMIAGSVAVDTELSGDGVSAGTRILANISGTGGAGTYLVAPSQTVAQTLLSAGSIGALEPTEYTIQIDVHGPNSADNAQRISQLFRDEYGVRTIQGINPDVTPLHADDPRQIPFTNGEQQVETRFVINAVLQVNYTMNYPMQFADQLDATTIEVEAAFPA